VLFADDAGELAWNRGGIVTVVGAELVRLNLRMGTRLCGAITGAAGYDASVSLPESWEPG